MQKISLPGLFALGAVVTMALAAGAVLPFAPATRPLLEALAPCWLGIVCVFWLLWRRVDRTLRDGGGR